MSGNNSLSNEKTIELLDEYFKEKNVLFKHLTNSYNKMIEKVINYLQTNNGVFDENKSGKMIYRHYFKFENVVARPMKKSNGVDLVFPNDALISKLTYNVRLVGKISQYMEVYDLVKQEIVDTQLVGEPMESETIMIIPNMVGSKTCATQIEKNAKNNECELDPGGYFIVGGGEKLMLSIEQIASNMPLVFISKDTSGSQTYKLQINSESDDVNDMIQKTQIILKQDKGIILKVPIFQEVSVFVILRALGFETDKSMVNYICYDPEDREMRDLLEVSIKLSKMDGKILSKNDAINYLINKTKVHDKYSSQNKDTRYAEGNEYLKMLFEISFLPHLNSSNYNDIYKVKGMFLCYLINKLLNCYLGRTPLDDRDSYTKKRLILPGVTGYGIVIRNHRKMLSECHQQYKRTGATNEKPINIINTINPTKVELDFQKTLSKGDNDETQGVLAIILPRLSNMQTLLFLRRIDTSGVDSNTMSKLLSPRVYNTSQIGFIDATETPEHTNIGLIKHFALLTSVTIEDEMQFDIIFNYISEHSDFLNINNLTSHDLIKGAKIFVNGKWIGISKKAYELYQTLKNLKQNSIIDKRNGVIYDVHKNEIRIYTDGGRLYRPIIRVENNQLMLSDYMIDNILSNDTFQGINKWDLLISTYPEAIDYIDIEEQYYLVIASTKENLYDMKKRESIVYPDTKKPIINRYDESIIVTYTHCEFPQVYTMGLIASQTIFANYNMCLRNMVHYAQGKQAMGIYATNFDHRIDISNILSYPQKPLIYSVTAKYIHSDRLPSGENIVLLIANYGGYNQDDSLIGNKTSTDAGLFCSLALKKFESILKKNQTTTEENYFGLPSKSKLIDDDVVSYDKLTSKGYPLEGTIIKNGDAIIGKITPISDGNEKSTKDSSEIYRVNYPCIVDKVYAGLKNADGADMIRIRTISEKKPKIGDKFCVNMNKSYVLTIDKKWKLMSDLTMNDYIAVNIDDRIVFEKPISIINITYNDVCHKISSEHVDLIVTKEHSLYVNVDGSYGLKTASDLFGKNFHMSRNIKNMNNGSNGIVFSLFERHDIYDILTIFGLFLGYGEFSDINILEFTLSHNIQLFKSTLQNLNITYSQDENNCKYYVEDKLLYSFFNAQTTSFNLELSKEQIRFMIAVMSYECVILNNYKNNGLIEYLLLMSEYSYTENANNFKYYESRDDIKYPYVSEGSHSYVSSNGGNYGCVEVSSGIFLIKQDWNSIWIGNCCYSGDHEVYTKNGWKDIVAVTIDDELICLENNKIIYKNPVRTMNYDIDDTMVHIKNEQLDLFVTENHYMYVKNDDGEYCLTEMQELYEKNITFVNTPKIKTTPMYIQGGCDGYHYFIPFNEIFKILLIYYSRNVSQEYQERYEKQFGLLYDSCKNFIMHVSQNIKTLIENYSLNANILRIICIDDVIYYNKLSDIDFETLLEIIMRSNLRWAHHNGGIKIYDDQEIIIKSYNVKKKHYRGKVYCVQMYDDEQYEENPLLGVIMVRRKNSNLSIWCGNSRMGCKGVYGCMMHSSEMPYTKDGLIPDIIINPHGFPTRMILAQLMENALGKIAAIRGVEINGTPFTNIDIKRDIMEQLEELGLNDDSSEVFYSGFTGKKIKKTLTVGINYYYRLKQLVDDKVYARNFGGTTLLTRQPLEGRSKGGGGRLGEMERDALITHGNAFTLKERLLDMSDIYTVSVCDICGLFAQRIKKNINKSYPKKTDAFECTICKNKNKISEIKIPYSAKLLFQELMSMNISPRIRTTNYQEPSI